jgi:hypothetical protein
MHPPFQLTVKYLQGCQIWIVVEKFIILAHMKNVVVIKIFVANPAGASSIASPHPPQLLAFGNRRTFE